MDLSKGYWRRKGVEAQVTLSSALLGRWLRLFQRLLGSCSRNWSREKAIKCFKVCKNTLLPTVEDTRRAPHPEQPGQHLLVVTGKLTLLSGAQTPPTECVRL